MLKGKIRYIIGATILVIIIAMTTAWLGLKIYFPNIDVESATKILSSFSKIKGRYVGEVTNESLTNSAITGMVKSLEDPHSVYWNKDEYEKFKQILEENFGGIGIEVEMKDNMINVVSPIEGTPAFNAGIQSGDKIVKINGESTSNMKLDQATGKMRGPEGTKVVITIKRNDKETDYELIRAKIPHKVIYSKMLENNIGYIRVISFSKNVSKYFGAEYEKLEQQGMKGLVIDLRYNGGGFLEESVKMAEKLVPKGPIVSVVDHNGKKETYVSNLDQVKYPLVVLVNDGSASASEILAGAIKDTGSGTLVGTKAYGKGSVQSTFEFFDNSAIKLTIAKYYTPNGTSIDGVGIEPDVKVDFVNKGKDTVDDQLNKGIEIIKEKIK